jgi:hypothetical protein
MILLSVCCAGVAEAQPVVADYSAADAGKWTAHFKSRQELSQFLDGWYLHTDRPGDAEKPMTRFDFVDMFYFHLDRLTNLAAFKLKLKTSEEFYAFVRKNPAYAINYPYSASGVPARYGKAEFKDVRRNDNYGFETLDKLGVNFCDKDGFCHPEQEITEREFYEWVGKVYGIKFDGASVSDKPMTRGKMGAPLVRAIQANFERVEKILNQMPNSAQKADVIKNLPSKGRAQITDKLKFYVPDSPCADLSDASEDLKKAFAGGGIWGDYRIDKGDVGDIVFETADTCEKGRIFLLRVGSAIVTMSEKGIKRLK